MKVVQLKSGDLIPRRRSAQSVVIYTDAPGKVNASYWLRPVVNSAVSPSHLLIKQEPK